MSSFFTFLTLFVCVILFIAGSCFIIFSRKLGNNAYNFGIPGKSILTYFAKKWGLSYFVWWYRIGGVCFIGVAIFLVIQVVISGN
jgi:hypothetical protein